MEDDKRINDMIYYFMLGDTTQCKTAKLYFISKSQEVLDCSEAYMNNKDTKIC